MASFKDKTGQLWEVSFSVGLCRKIKACHALDFVNAHDAKAVSALEENDELLISVMWMICEDQAIKRGIDELAFANLLDGDVLSDGQSAIEEALIFFSRPEKREALRAIFEKKRQAINTSIRLAAEKIRQTDLEPEIARQIDEIAKSLTPGKS